jgi:2,3-bisphosphoglycerate-independent phosphoglycerate mutase
LIEHIDAALGSGNADTAGRVRFYPGVSYRHALIIASGEKTAGGIGDVASESDGYRLTPPHDILERRVGDYMPKGEGSAFIVSFMRESYRLLKAHPVNLAREKAGRNPGNAIWIWGQGKRPNLATFRSKFGIEGSVVSAVDLIKGIGICAGLDAPSVAGATGTLETNFSGKAEAAINAFKSGKDFVYIHVEAPDECSHQGNRAEKIMAIERIDLDVLRPTLDYLVDCGEDYRILIVPDHRTPLSIRTHSDEPVPYVLFDSRKAMPEDGGKAFSERAGAAGRLFESGQALAEYFFGG